MRNLLIVFFIVSLIVLIVIFPFKTRIMGHVNLLDLKCFYSIKIWIIKLVCGKIVVENGMIKMSNEKTILSGNYKSKFVKALTSNVFERIDIKKLELFFVGGFKEDSFLSAIMCGSIDSFIETLYGYLSLKCDDIKMYKDIKPTFYNDNLELTFDVAVSISLIKLVVSLILAKKKSKELKEI